VRCCTGWAANGQRQIPRPASARITATFLKDKNFKQTKIQLNHFIHRPGSLPHLEKSGGHRRTSDVYFTLVTLSGTRTEEPT